MNVPNSAVRILAKTSSTKNCLGRQFFYPMSIWEWFWPFISSLFCGYFLWRWHFVFGSYCKTKVSFLFFHLKNGSLADRSGQMFCYPNCFAVTDIFQYHLHIQICGQNHTVCLFWFNSCLYFEYTAKYNSSLVSCFSTLVSVF